MSEIDNVEKLGEELTAFLEAENKKLKAEVEHQRAIAEAMLDSLHKLGDDYRKALKEINRKDAEIERLTTMNSELNIGIKKLKEFAVKEFAERLKSKQIVAHKSKECVCVYEFDDELIDNLVEEMVGDSDER